MYRIITIKIEEFEDPKLNKDEESDTPDRLLNSVSGSISTEKIKKMKKEFGIDSIAMLISALNQTLDKSSDKKIGE